MSSTNAEDPIDDQPMPLLDHLIELRRRLMWSVSSFMVCFLICYHFSDVLFYWLADPLAQRAPGKQHRVCGAVLARAGVRGGVGGGGGGAGGGRWVGWYGPVAVIVNKARKGVCNGRVKNTL